MKSVLMISLCFLAVVFVSCNLSEKTRKQKAVQVTILSPAGVKTSCTLYPSKDPAMLYPGLRNNGQIVGWTLAGEEVCIIPPADSTVTISRCDVTFEETK